MKTSTKILILAIALFVVAGSIVYFFRTVTSPPVVSDIDPIKTDLDQDIVKIDEIKTTGQLDSLFDVFVSEAHLWNKNHLIVKNDAQGYLESFFNKFISVYVNTYHNYLLNHSWNKAQKSKMIDRTAMMRNVKMIEDDDAVLSKLTNVNAVLKDLDVIGSDYDAVDKLRKVTNFVDLGTSEARIQKMNGYRRNKYLSNSDLAHDMNSYAERLGDEHYNTLKQLCDNMKNWRNVSLNSSEAIYNRFKKNWTGYSNTTLYGGHHPQNTDEMKSEMDHLMRDAYDEKCYLTVDGYSSDLSVTFTNAGDYMKSKVITNHPNGVSVDNNTNFCYVELADDDLTIKLRDQDYGERHGTVRVRAGNKIIDIAVTKRIEYVPSSNNRNSYILYAGNIAGQYFVRAKLLFDNNSVNGTYYYLSQGSDNILILKGYTDGNSVIMQEYTVDGQKCGTFNGTISGNEIWGTFYNANGNSMSFYLEEE